MRREVYILTNKIIHHISEERLMVYYDVVHSMRADIDNKEMKMLRRSQIMQGFEYWAEECWLHCLAVESHGSFENFCPGVLSKRVQYLHTLEKSFQC